MKGKRVEADDLHIDIIMDSLTLLLTDGKAIAEAKPMSLASAIALP